MSNLVLRPLAVVDEQAAREAHAELAAEGFEFLLDLRDDEPWAPRTSTGWTASATAWTCLLIVCRRPS